MSRLRDTARFELLTSEKTYLLQKRTQIEKVDPDVGGCLLHSYCVYGEVKCLLRLRRFLLLRFDIIYSVYLVFIIIEQIKQGTSRGEE